MALARHVDNIESLLVSVLRWLENSDESERWWQTQTQVCKLCLFELELVSKARELDARFAVGVTDILRQLREMVEAMEKRNRAVALRNGKQVLEPLSGLL